MRTPLPTWSFGLATCPTPSRIPSEGRGWSWTIGWFPWRPGSPTLCGKRPALLTPDNSWRARAVEETSTKAFPISSWRIRLGSRHRYFSCQFFSYFQLFYFIGAGSHLCAEGEATIPSCPCCSQDQIPGGCASHQRALYRLGSPGAEWRTIR